MDQNEFDRAMMRRALELARKGTGFVSPNPKVGAIITGADNTIIAEGWHQRFGEAHAEINALAAAAGNDLTGATLYVTLEPCSHHGKTPPCADAVVASGIRRVVVAMRDPNPLVGGQGNKRMREAGIEVIVGVQEKEAQQLNESYIHYVKHGSPFVTAKVAQSLDGYIALPSGESKWITGELARERGHRMRASNDAILIGTKTAQQDDPSLTLRYGIPGRTPKRVVIDRHLELPETLRLFTDEYADHTIVFTTVEMEETERAKFLREGGVTVLGIQAETDPVNIRLDQLLRVLGEQEITSVLVEGGAALVDSFIAKGLTHKLVMFIAPKLLGHGIKPFTQLAVTHLDDARTFNIHKTEMVGEDIMVVAYCQNE